MGSKKSQTVGYRYFVGVHFVLCHGPIDRILQIKVDDKLLWNPVKDGQGVGVEGGYETLAVHAPELFGGEDREGGISGEIDVGMGYRAQGKNSYLQQVLAGKLIPAYRGVVSVILRKIYAGTNPYLKAWKFRVQRIWAPSASERLQWSPPNAGIGEPGQQYILLNVFGPSFGHFPSASTMIDGRLYTVRLYVVEDEMYERPIGATTKSGIHLTVHDYNTGVSTWEADIPRKAPYKDFFILPLTDDVLVIDGGTKFLFPLCLDATVTSGIWQNALATWRLDGHYAAIFDPVAKTVTRIPYPASPLMASNNRLAAVGRRNWLGARFAAAWDDDIDGHYVVMGPEGSTYRLVPLRGEVVPLYNHLDVSQNSHVIAYQKAPQRRLFVLWYTAISVMGQKRDQITAGLYDTETGMEIWQSGPSLIPGGAFVGVGQDRVGPISDVTAVCLEDRFVYVFLSRTMASYFGKRVLIYNTATPSGSSPELSDMGLPWYKPGGGVNNPYDWQGGNAIGVYKGSRVGADGRTYLFSTFSSEPGVIMTPGLGPGLRPGTVVQMPWTNERRANPGANRIDLADFTWHGTPVAITARWDAEPDNNLTPLTGVDGGTADFISPGPWDMNPIHIIRECITNTEWGRGLPESIIGPTYAAAASTLYKERLGLSMLWTSELAVNDFILEVIRHIDAVRYEDPETGLQEIKLIRPDYDVATLPVLTPSNCRIEQLTEPTLYDLVNQITVEYWDRDKGEDSAIAVQDTAAINMSGTVNNQTMQYSGICKASVAMMVGQRDLARYSKPFRSGRLIVNRKVANLKPGDPFVLTWPERGVSQMVCRVAKRSDNGELDGMIGIEFGEDIFSAPYNIAAIPPPSGWEDPIKPPVNFDYVTMFDLPYALLVEDLGEAEIASVPTGAGYAGFAGARPLTGSHMNYGLFLYAAGTTPPTDSQLERSTSFTPLAILTDALPELTDPVVDLAVGPTTDMANARAGDWILVGGSADPVREMMCLVEDPGSSPVSLKVTRAVADTFPRAVPAGTPLYLVGTFYGTDEVERVDGEDVAGYGRPKNGKGAYAGPYTYLEAEMVARQGRPYPAALFKVDGSYSADLTVAKERVELTWAHRHRVQQSNQPVSWLTPGNVGPEPGVAYRVQQAALDDQQAEIAKLPPVNVGTVDHYTLELMDQPYPVAAKYATISVEAVRDGVVSLQNRPVTVKLAAKLLRPYNLRPGVAAEIKAPYNLRPGVALVLKAPYNLRSSVQVELRAPYNLRSTVQVELLGPYNLRSSVQAELLGPYNLRPGSSEVALLAPYNLRSSAQAELLGPYNLRSSVQAELLPPYGLRSSVQAELLGPYNLRSSVQAELLGPYNLRSSVQAELLGPYNLRSSVQAELLGPYNLRSSVQAELLGPYGLRSSVQAELLPPYGLRSTAQAELLGPYGLRSTAQAELVAPYNLQVFVQGELVAPYALQPFAQGELVPPYNLTPGGLA